MTLMSSCFATAELADKLAVSGVVRQGASHVVHQAGVPAGAAWGPHLEVVMCVCQLPATYK